MKSTDPVKRPKSMRANRADHVVGQAAGRSASAAGGGGEGTTPSSDWMAEMSAERQPGAAPQQPEPGVPVSTRAPGDRSRGKAVESKRGQR